MEISRNFELVGGMCIRTSIFGIKAFADDFKPFKLGDHHLHLCKYEVPYNRSYCFFVAPFMGFCPWDPRRCNVIIGLS